MTQIPDGTNAQRRCSFDRQCPTHTLCQETKINDCLGGPLKAGSTCAAPRNLVSRQCRGIAGHLCSRRKQEGVVQELGWHVGILLQPLPKEGEQSESRSTTKMPGEKRSLAFHAQLCYRDNPRARDLNHSITMGIKLLTNSPYQLTLPFSAIPAKGRFDRSDFRNFQLRAGFTQPCR